VLRQRRNAGVHRLAQGGATVNDDRDPVIRLGVRQPVKIVVVDPSG